MVLAADPVGRVREVSPVGGFHYQGCVRPDGAAVVFHGGTSGRSRVWRTDLRSGGMEAITPADVGARQASYDWQGRRIAYVSDRQSAVPGEQVASLPTNQRAAGPSHLHIEVVEDGGGSPRTLTSGPHRDQRPSFTADGRFVLFVSDRAGGSALYRVAVDDPDEPELLFAGTPVFRPWATTDARVLCYTVTSERHRVASVAAGDRQVRTFPADDRGRTHGPFVGASGGPVLVHSDRSGPWRLWEMPDDGPMIDITPPGVATAAHPTRAVDGTLVFDVS